MAKSRCLIAGLALLLVFVSVLWMFLGLGEGARGFILQLRAVKLAAMITVAAAIGVATILFQTVSANRVLTPSIMGFDSLYVLIQTLLVASLGISGFVALPTGLKFGAEVLIMIVLAVILFGTLLARNARDIPRMILTGVILGFMFRSISGFLGRILDPNEYSVVQSSSFASFARADVALLPWATGLAMIAMALAFRFAPRLDVMGLGRTVAISLGLRFDRMALMMLAIVALLVSVSTALVGPVAVGPVGFFGLIVAGLTHGITRSTRHAVLLPTAALIGAIIIVLGQLIFERGMNQAATMTVIIDFCGGLFFLYLLLKGRIR